MTPALAATALEPPKRMVFVCTTLGLHPASWWPETPGAVYETTEYLELLQDHQDVFTLFSELSHEGQAGRQPHNCETTWLTAARGPGLDGFRNTISVDQLAAERLSYTTRFPSIVLGSNSTNSQSFTRSGVMIPAETSPAGLFGDLFLQGNPTEIARQRRNLKDGRSILDQLVDQTRGLRRRANSRDNDQLDEYLQSVRQTERDIGEAEGWLDRPKPAVEADRPTDIPNRADLIGRTQLLLNMIPLILQTDSSRVVSVMIQDHQVVPEVVGVSAEHHNLSHHGQDETKIEQLRKIESELVRSFGGLLAQLRGKAESGGSLLDTTSVLFGSNLGNANSHDTRNLPILLAGGGFEHGRYVAHDADRNTPLCNLFLTMLHGMGIEADSFGQSSGTLTW